MAKYNLTIKKTFILNIFLSLLLSIFITFILLHFGEFEFQGKLYGYFYINSFLDIRYALPQKSSYYLEMTPSLPYYPSEYSERFNIYLKILFSSGRLGILLIISLILLLIINIIKFVKIRID